VIAGAAARVHACRAGFAEHFSRHHHIFTRHFKIFQCLAGDLLGAAFGIDVGGIDKIDACVQRAADQLVRLRLIQLPNFAPHAALTAERHGAEAQFRNKQTGIAEFLITHLASPHTVG
jgi:hypothetical protein